MYWPSNGQLLFMAILIGVIGWGVIEAVLWVLRHLSVAWNWRPTAFLSRARTRVHEENPQRHGRRTERTCWAGLLRRA
jgi:hypothetical protein